MSYHYRLSCRRCNVMLFFSDMICYNFQFHIGYIVTNIGLLWYMSKQWALSFCPNSIVLQIHTALIKNLCIYDTGRSDNTLQKLIISSSSSAFMSLQTRFLGTRISTIRWTCKWFSFFVYWHYMWIEIPSICWCIAA